VRVSLDSSNEVVEQRGRYEELEVGLKINEIEKRGKHQRRVVRLKRSLRKTRRTFW